MKNYYFIKAGMMLARSPGWSKDIYGFDPNGIGDGNGRSSVAARIYGLPEMLQQNVDLLKAGKRWPDELGTYKTNPHIARNILDYEWCKLMHKLGQRDFRKYRSQGSITRDPIIGVICSLYLMKDRVYSEWKNQIKDIKIRWWQNRPDLYHWKKYLETGKAKHKHKYEWWAKLNITWFTPVYALNHMAWMAYVAESDKVKKELWKRIPYWNYLLRELTNHPLNHLHKLLVEYYLAKSGDQWSHPIWITPPDDSHFYLDEDDQYKLDKDELNYITNR